MPFAASWRQGGVSKISFHNVAVETQNFASLQSDWVKYQCFMLAVAAEGLVEVDDGLQGCKAVIDHVETCREQRLAGCD